MNDVISAIGGLAVLVLCFVCVHIVIAIITRRGP